MKGRLYVSAFAAAVAAVLLMCASCNGTHTPSAKKVSESSAVGNKSEPVSPEAYMPPKPPAIITDEERIWEFYRSHFWDNLQMSEDTCPVDTDMYIKAFIAYTSLMDSRDSTCIMQMERFLHRISGNKAELDLVSMMAKNVLNDPNSPYRDDELYIPVLRARIESGLYDNATSTRDSYTLNIALQNRIGHKANDFRYRLADGSYGKLYDLKAPYTLVFINNPGCNMCRTVRESIMANGQLMKLISDRTVRVLAIYPDEDLDDWKEYYDDIPSDWLNGYDEGCLIRKTGSYKIDAIPALYLLDADKKVLVKDGTDVNEILNVLLADMRG